MTDASCLCGRVRWRVSGAMTPPSHCHCSMCRKAHGTPFATFTSCAEEDFEWLAGTDGIEVFASSDILSRPFCRTCGTAVPQRYAEEPRMDVPVGPFIEDPGLSGGRHIFVASKAQWYEIADALERHDAYPDKSFAVDRPDPGQAEPGIRRGSCLCGGVAYELSAPFRMIYYCHCSRCRRARSAVHCANGFVPLDALRFTRSEELLAEYKLPEAESFGQEFCTVCGSAMPRRRPATGMASVPLGSLDDPPGRSPDAHIFVASKAPWYEITGDVPQNDGMPG